MNDSTRLIVAIVSSIGILLGFNIFYDAPKRAEKLAHEQNSQSLEKPNPSSTNNSGKNKDVINADFTENREDAIRDSKRISINSEKIKGSINLKGAVVDDISLKDYHETTDKQSPEIVLLSPSSTKNAFYFFGGWKKSENYDFGKIPDMNTVWKIEGSTKELTSSTPITLYWFNESGIKFERTIKLDDKYLFTITDKVTNLGNSDVALQPFAEIIRVNPPQSAGFFILHEGPIGVFNKRLFETSYEDLQKDNVSKTFRGGWFGFTDKYWLVSLIPDQNSMANMVYSSLGANGYKESFYGSFSKIVAGASASYTYNLFAGPKVLRILDTYENQNGFQRFDLAVDFGWFYFITKPLFYVLEFMHQMLGNLGLAILLLTVLFKIFLYPFANKSYKSMANMKNLQPKLEQIKKKYEHDKIRMNQEIMNFYKKEKINPMGGCLPMLIQAPIFFCLYKVFFVTIEMRHAPFFWWIKDLSAPDPTSLFNLFGLLNWTPPSFLQIGVLPLIMGGTMVLQQRLNPQPIDPIQARVMLIMPIMFTYMFASFPAGLVVYWAWNNVLSILQQWYITKGTK
jgi:YidC/Oxa1 family membrane protein insertase